MKKFLVLYHATSDAMKQTGSTSTEDQSKSMEAWMHWAAKCGDNLLDMGNPLMNGQAVDPTGKSRDSEKGVVGYSLIQAKSMDEAEGLLKGHPHLGWDADCRIEVHEIMPLPGM